MLPSEPTSNIASLVRTGFLQERGIADSILLPFRPHTQIAILINFDVNHVGPISFTTVGVLASLVQPLSKAGIGVFAVSTFDTDYLLLKAADLEREIDCLRQSGHNVR